MRMKRGWYGEPTRHALSARGIKNAKPHERRMKYGSPFSQKNFNRLTREQQRGNILDLAKKSYAGMKHAVQWERDHLPQQSKWVKDEFNEAKNAVQKFVEKEKTDPESAYNNTKEWVKETYDQAGQNITEFKKELTKQPTGFIDRAEVADEKDHDEDGSPDITDDQLDRKNAEIGIELETPQTFFGRQGEKIRGKIEAKRNKRLAKFQDDVFEFGTKKERKELLKDPENITLSKLSDKTLEELAIRDEEGLVFGGNRFEQALLDRIKRRNELALKKAKVNAQIQEKKDELNKELARRRKELKQREKEANEEGGLGDLFSF